MMTAVGVNNLKTFISSRLEKQIINLELLPGTKLSEIRVAKMFNCSRTPVRDAFYELRVKGFLESRPQVSTFVSKIDLNRVEEVRFIRESVEIAVLRPGIEKDMFTSQLPLIQANISGMKNTYDKKDMRLFTELDIMFHNILYNAVGKGFVQNYAGDNDVHYSRIRFMVTRRKENMIRTIKEHQCIFDLIKSGSTKGVNELISTHLNNIYNYVDNMSPDYNKLFEGSM